MIFSKINTLFNVDHVVAYTLTLPLPFVAWNQTFKSFISIKQLLLFNLLAIFTFLGIYIASLSTNTSTLTEYRTVAESISHTLQLFHYIPLLHRLSPQN